MKKCEFIKQRLTCKDLMNIDHNRNISCPFHEDKTPSFSFYDEGRKFKCFSCGETGSVIDLYAKLNNTSEENAIIELYKRCGGKINEYIPRFKKQISENEKLKPFLKSRGIDYEKVKSFVGFENGFLTAVLKSQAGEIVGTQKRCLERKQFRITGEAGLLYNDKTQKGELYITEGLTDWLTIRQHTEQVLGFISASSLPECEEIIKKYSQIYWLCDTDKAGEGLKEKFLSKFTEQDFYELPDRKEDINELNPTIEYIQENAKLTRKGRKVFEDTFCVMYDIINEMENTNEKDILTYTIDEIDSATGGIYPTTLSVIAAETGFGKSEMLCNIAYENARNGKKVLYFDFENDFGNIIRRKAISKFNYRNNSKIGIKDLKTNTILNSELSNKLSDVFNEILNEVGHNLLIYDNKKIPTFTEFIQYLDLVKDANLIVIDHLHYFAFEDEELMSMQLGKMMRAFRTLTKERKIPIISASHLRKLQKGKHPDNDDIFGSSNIAKESEVVIMISRLEETYYNTKIAITKSRNDTKREFKANFDLLTRRYKGKLANYNQNDLTFN